MAPRPLLVDFHCHLDLYPDLEQAVEECDSHAIATLTVTTTPKAFPRNRAVAANSRFVRVALGLHPQLVVERAEEIDLFERLLPESRYVGEVGLDGGPHYFRSLDQQREVFAHILNLCAKAGNKILTVHSVRAIRPVLDLLERHLPTETCRVVLHWFTGSASEARRAAALGCYFSINGQMLVSDKHRALIAKLPRDRLLTETDGPFVKRDGQPIRPQHVADTVRALGIVLETPEEVLRRDIVNNLVRLVGGDQANHSLRQVRS